MLVDKLMIFLVRRYYRTMNTRRILVKHIIADMPELAKREIVGSLLPPGKHIHGNPKKKRQQQTEIQHEDQANAA